MIVKRVIVIFKDIITFQLSSRLFKNDVFEEKTQKHDN
jgi:hypothetical protein